MSVACRANAALAQWTTAVQSAAMAVLAVERAVMLCQRDGPKTDPRNHRVMKLLPAVIWLYGTALVAPIAATSDVVGVRPFPDRYSCWIVPTSKDSKDLLYPTLLLIFGYVLPWTVTLIITTVIICRIISARRRQKQLEQAALQRSQGIGSSNVLLHSISHQKSWRDWLGGSGPLSWEEVKFYLLSSMLLLLYIILIVPHVLCANVPSLTGKIVLHDSAASSDNALVGLEPVQTGTYDCVFIWFRYKFTVLAPIIIIAVHKEVRKKCEHMFCCCCCRNNAVVHLDNPRSISACVEKRGHLPDQQLIDQRKNQVSRQRNRNKKDKYSRAAHYRTPVLFATSEGLHLRTVDDIWYLNETDTGGVHAGRGKEQHWTVEPKFLCEFCDVALIVSTPTKKAANKISQQNINRGLRPPMFLEETLAEEDMQVSEDMTGESSGEFGRKPSYGQETLLAINNRNVSINNNNNNNNNRKVTRVRFAQTVSEIPLSESGVWSAPEDQGLVQESALYKQSEPQHHFQLLNQKSKVNAPTRFRTETS